MKRWLFVGALALCMFLPGVASAQNVKPRPFHGTGHSQMVIRFSETCLPPSVNPTFPIGCTYEGHGEVVATHLGLSTVSVAGIIVPPPQYANSLVIAANGDQLSFFSLETADTSDMTITGGTGRFEGATGHIILVKTLDGDPIIDGTSFTQRYVLTVKGTITY